jgi:hypothetical protein
VPDREHADKIVILGLPKGFLHKVSVQAGLNNRVGAPIGKVRDQDILAESVDMSAESSRTTIPSFLIKSFDILRSLIVCSVVWPPSHRRTP